MGRVIAACIAGRADSEIAAGADVSPFPGVDFPMFTTVTDCTVPVDVIVDFSHPAALASVLEYASQHRVGAVIATTGLSQNQEDEVKRAAESVPVFRSGNMSLGINLLMELIKKAAGVLRDFDIEIVEAHHNQKLDAPSGTAFMLADAAAFACDSPKSYEYDRHSRRAKRRREEIGIHSVRGGTIVGEHEVIFAGHDEIITLSHSARSKEIFAVGAINAAIFLAGKEPGLYDMSDLVNA
jgi:4-hydroxy-tetrahydrodipicolinate reductase